MADHGHRLRIETGRMESPKKREDRTCAMCKTEIEDEYHVLFKCPIYNRIRVKFESIFSEHDSVESILNPRGIKEADLLGCLLREIEKVRESRGMEFVNT